TLLSALVSLSIIVMMLPFFSMTLKLMQNNHHEYTIDVEHFFTFLRDDIIDATDIRVSNSTLTLHLSTNKVASYSLYEQVFRRQIQNKGHEIYIRNIKDVHFTLNDHSILVELKTTNGEHYTKEFLRYE